MYWTKNYVQAYILFKYVILENMLLQEYYFTCYIFKQYVPYGNGTALVGDWFKLVFGKWNGPFRHWTWDWTGCWLDRHKELISILSVSHFNWHFVPQIYHNVNWILITCFIQRLILYILLRHLKISTNKTVNIFRQLSHDKSMEKTIQDVLQKRKVHKNISNKL